MKKFYAIFSALMLLFSVSAYSQLQTPRQLKMKQLKEQVRQKHDKHALMDFGKLAKSPVKSPRLAAKARLTKGKTVKNAESIDVTITCLPFMTQKLRPSGTVCPLTACHPRSLSLSMYPMVSGT